MLYILFIVLFLILNSSISNCLIHIEKILNKNFVYLRNYSNTHVYHNKINIVFIFVFAGMLLIQLASEFQIVLCKYSELSSIYLLDCCISLFHMTFSAAF